MKDINCLDNSRVKDVLRKIDNEIIKLFGDKLQDIILYGSYARNENTTESDIDIMILVNEDESKLKKYEDKITDIMVDLSLEYGIVVSLYTQSVQDYQRQINVLPFLKNIQREGIRIHG